MLLVCVAAAPAFAVLINLQRELHQAREVQARTIALQQAELLNASVGGIVQSAQQTMLAIAGAATVARLDPACQEELDGVRAGMPGQTLIAVLRADGSTVCSSPRALPEGALQAVFTGFSPAAGFQVGGYTAIPSLSQPLLTFALPIGGPAGPAGLVIFGVDLQQIDAAIRGIHQPGDNIIAVADRHFIALAQQPAQPGAIGKPVAAQLRAVAGSNAGTLQMRAPDGQDRVIGYVPPAAGGTGLLVAAGFNIADLSGELDRTADQGYLLIMLGISVSFLLALLVGHRYLRAPAAVLVQAARKWGAGDLTTRAEMPVGTVREFADLGQAFNEMAELLRVQRTELQSLNEALEVRVGERTRALLESNNRLQVEIAERELTEASLRQAQKLQVVGQLAGGIAHDFNNLLTSILGSLELLRSSWTGVDKRQARLFENAIESTNRGARLTSQLLAFSRKQPLIAISVDVAAAIEGMTGLLSSTLGAAIRVDCRVQADLWPCLLDPNQFEAAILNLALNARDAMPRGGRLTLSASNYAVTPVSQWTELAPGDYVRVIVADTGSGMAEEVVSRAFEPFFTTKATGKGSGLGLSQVHGMVRQSGGSVAIDSRPGMGTKVTMVLPRSKAEPYNDYAADVDPSLPVFPPEQLILLVDDDTNVREVTEATLADCGYSVATAADGSSALQLLDQQGDHVAMVIADYAMPGMTGRELLDIVRRRRPDVTIMLATGYADYAELTGEGLALDQIIRKPFRSKELLARIHLVHSRKRAAMAHAHEI